MKKRIFALAAALLLLFSSLAFSACKQEKNEQSDETSTASAKEIFESSLRNKFTFDENSELMTKLNEFSEIQAKDVFGVMNTKITKLTVGEFDLSGIGDISLDGNIAFDADNKRTSGDFTFNAMGEKPAIAFVADESGAYITNLLGLNEKPLFLDPNKQAEALDPEKTERIKNAINAYADIYSHAKASAEAVIAADIEESAFTSVIKEAQFDTSFFTNANEITLTVKGEKAKEIATKLIDELLKSEDIKALLGGEFDKNELLANAENVKEIRMINTVHEGETVAFDIAIDAKNEEESESYLLKSVLIKGNYMSALGTLDDNGKYDRAVEFAYNGEAEAGKQGITADITKEGKTYNALTAYMTKQESKYDFDITVCSNEKEAVNAKLLFNGDKESGNVSVLEVNVTDADGISKKLPIICNIEYKIENEILTVKSLINASPNENMSVEAESVFTGEYKDVTLEAVSDYMPIEEFDSETAKIAFAFKYPKINTVMLMYELQK